MLVSKVWTSLMSFALDSRPRGGRLWFSAGFTRKAELLSYTRRSLTKYLVISFSMWIIPLAFSTQHLAGPACGRSYCATWGSVLTHRAADPSLTGAGREQQHGSLMQNQPRGPRWQPQPRPCPAPTTPRGDKSSGTLLRVTSVPGMGGRAEAVTSQ